MICIVDRQNRTHEHQVLRSMFEARKRVFVDLLKWDLPVLAGRFEVDQFDDGSATYLIVADGAREHLASARLLATTQPALLDTLYPELCDEGVPRGPDIFEITRFCLSRDIGAPMRRFARDQLLCALVRHAQAHGIRTYTGVADLSWFRQIERFGWDCRALGDPCVCDGRVLTALSIAIDPDTLGKLAAAGIGVEPALADAA